MRNYLSTLSQKARKTWSYRFWGSVANQILRYAQDFGCGLPLRSHPQSASSCTCPGDSAQYSCAALPRNGRFKDAFRRVRASYYVEKIYWTASTSPRSGRFNTRSEPAGAAEIAFNIPVLEKHL
jgi:hypothetical protein